MLKFKNSGFNPELTDFTGSSSINLLERDPFSQLELGFSSNYQIYGAASYHFNHQNKEIKLFKAMPSDFSEVPDPPLGFDDNELPKQNKSEEKQNEISAPIKETADENPKENITSETETTIDKTDKSEQLDSNKNSEHLSYNDNDISDYLNDPDYHDTSSVDTSEKLNDDNSSDLSNTADDSKEKKRKSKNNSTRIENSDKEEDVSFESETDTNNTDFQDKKKTSDYLNDPDYQDNLANDTIEEQKTSCPFNFNKDKDKDENINESESSKDANSTENELTERKEFFGKPPFGVESKPVRENLLYPTGANKMNTAEKWYMMNSYDEDPKYMQQDFFNEKNGFSDVFGANACFATSILNEVSEEYTIETGLRLTNAQAIKMMKKAVDDGYIGSEKAFVHNTAAAANSMSSVVNMKGTWSVERIDGAFIEDGKHEIYQVNGHFVNTFDTATSNSGTQIFDVLNSQVKKVKPGVFNDRDKDGKILETTHNGHSFDHREIISTRILKYKIK